MNDLEKINLCHYSINEFLMYNFATVNELLMAITSDDISSNATVRAYMLANGIISRFNEDVEPRELQYYRSKEGHLIKKQLNSNLIATYKSMVDFVVNEIESFSYAQRGQASRRWYYGGCRHMTEENVLKLIKALQSETPMNDIVSLNIEIAAQADKMNEEQIQTYGSNEPTYNSRCIYPYEYGSIAKSTRKTLHDILDQYVEAAFYNPANITARSILRAVFDLVSGSTATHVDMSHRDVMLSMRKIYNTSQVERNMGILLVHPSPGSLVTNEPCKFKDNKYTDDFYLLRDFITVSRFYEYCRAKRVKHHGICSEGRPEDIDQPMTKSGY